MHAILIIYRFDCFPRNRGLDARVIGLFSENAAAFIKEYALEIHFKGFRTWGMGHAFFFGDLAVFDQLVQGLVKGLHTVFLAGFNGGLQDFQFIFQQEFMD